MPFFRRIDEHFFALQTRMESHKVDGHTHVKRRLGAPFKLTREFPAGSLNQAIVGPFPRMIPFSLAKR